MSRAREQLGRMLWLIGRASRDEGVSPDEAAAALGVSAAQVLRDLTLLTDREFYLPAGSAEGLQIWQEDDGRWRMSGLRDLQRPVRLTPMEALCVALGIRGRRSEHDSDLLARIEEQLAVVPPGDRPAVGGGAVSTLSTPHVAIGELAPDPSGIRTSIVEAVRECRVCTFEYLKPGDGTPESRHLHPFVLATANGVWYAVGYDPGAAGERSFRVDRMIGVTVTDERFERPRDFKPDDVVRDGRVWVGGAPEPMIAEVRYAQPIARAVAEAWPVAGDPDPDGSVRVHHEVHDPAWMVHHVLLHAPWAELVSPPALRELVIDTARHMAGSVTASSTGS